MINGKANSELKLSGRVTLFKLKAVKVRKLICAEPCKITSAEQIVDIVEPVFRGLDRESMVVLYFDVQLKPIGVEVVAVGGTSACPVEIKNVFKGAILANASSIVVCHNHLSDNLKPSKEDKHLTRLIARAGAILDVQLVDHLIIGDEKKFYSFYMQDRLFLLNEVS